MFQFRCGFCFETKTSQVRFARPLTKANDLKRDCSIQTLLSRAKYHALTAAPDFLQQFVVAQLSQQLGSARCFCALRSSNICFVFIGTAVIGGGYRRVGEIAERGFQHASAAKPFRCARKDLCATLLTNSDYPDHC